MSARYGIDTSILVRLVTGDPGDGYERCVAALARLVEREDAEIFASNQVIGEAYMALQHHYGATRQEARSGLSSVLQSGLLAPIGGRKVLEALASATGAGLFDRLIALDYEERGVNILTLDRRMGSLPKARLLR